MSHRARTACLAALLLALAGAGERALAQATETSIRLVWTAPGDDSLSGQAARYDLRWSRAPIASLADFARATPLPGAPVPGPAGSPESATVTGLVPATSYWFALRTEDEAGNLAALSNVLGASTLASADVVRPAPIALALAGTTSSSVTVSWTDVGDDSLTGTASATEIRWATAPITEATWAGASPAYGEPAPGAPGTPRQLEIPGLDRARDLWFAARARDDVNRESAVNGSLPVPRLVDATPPAAPSGLTASLEPVRVVRLRWSPNAEPDVAGYHVYRALAPGDPPVRLTGSPVTASGYVDGTAPDSLAAWFAVSAVDFTGNESARSALLRVYLTGAGIVAWDLAVPYPNPSPAGGSVTIPISVPGSGPLDATVEIQDGAGQRVRRLELRNVVPGPTTLTWDGRNDAGLATAPGVYRVWLRAGDTRKLVRVLRTP